MKRYLTLCAVLALGMTACGADGISTLISTGDEPAGANCANGGVVVSIGQDGNGDAILDPSEVTTTRYLCNGESGANGTDGTNGTNGTNGMNGTNGTNGANGEDGADGEDGLSSIFATSDEEPGDNCEFGGKRIDYGVDDNGNTVLDEGEGDGFAFVCNTEVPQHYAIFTSNGVFVPPPGVTRVRVLVVGGGGGGAGSHYVGGGSGHVRVGEFDVTGAVDVAVGMGGSGADPGNDYSAENGQESSFGAFLTASGGEGSLAEAAGGGGGGSGGGGAGNGGFGGNGGTAGSDGEDGETYEGGVGGNFDDLEGFTSAIVAPGAGGLAGMSSNSGGGGGGGVLINWASPSGGNGAASFSGRGGHGYGGGGGSGGYSDSDGGYARGGNGANGVVYVEW